MTELHSPTIVIAPDDTTILQGSTALFTCVALGDTPPNIMWYRNGQKLYNDSRITVYNDTIEQGGLTFTQSVLELCSAEPSDEGEYTCVAIAARNYDAYSIANFTVDIVEPQGIYMYYSMRSAFHRLHRSLEGPEHS